MMEKKKKRSPLLFISRHRKLIALVFFAGNCNMYDAIITSFAIGLAADISGPVMGPYTLSFTLFGSLISQMRKVIITKKNDLNV